MPGAGKALQTFAGDIGEGACTSVIQCVRHGFLKINWSGDSDGDGWDDVAKLAHPILNI